MKITKRIISLFLTACMLLTMLLSFAVFETFGAEDGENENKDVQDIVEEYLTKKFYTPEEKLATMTKRLSKDGYELYVDTNTGEVATKNLATGEILFTNPYDLGTEGAVASPDSTSPRLLSQIIISYTDSAGKKATLNSFTDAAMRGQIVVKNIKNGIRVEYTIGRVETKYLVPRMITEARFLEYIKAPLEQAMQDGLFDAWEYNKLIGTGGSTGKYQRQDPEEKAAVANIYPITKEVGVIYTFDTNSATAKELTKAEQYIKAFCTEYSYEELDKDHNITKYEGIDKNPPVFKMALEYKIDEKGLTATLPASGIRFNQSIYTLESLTVLPYMGAGSYSTQTPNDGYIFFPDGSGALFNFKDLSKSQSNLSVGGMVYGVDYAYQTLQGSSHQETIRYPVFGVAEQTKQQVSDGYGTTVESTGARGFLAVLEEGDSMAELRASSGGSTHKYYNVEMNFYPRPKDTYVLTDAVSIGSNNEWTVISSRKYTGNYTIRYIMLSDTENSPYECSWIGMAKAYQDYLINEEVLTPLKQEELNEDIPLYIESFGAMKTVERIMSIPVEVMTPMTTFEDIKTMYNELSNNELLGDKAIDNVIFKLTGFANGGMYSRVPYKLKWEKKVGGKDGFKDLLQFSQDVSETTDGNLGIFPDFDFNYIKNTGAFDGLSNKKHAVKTIDDRYTSKRYYSATKQTYISYFELAISSAYFDHFYTKLTENYLKYSLNDGGSDLGISVSTLGTDLNSDFDEDEPYNREDSKEFTTEAFAYLGENYGSVMTDGANAYAWKYVDHILNMPMTSSRYLEAYASVPFMGMVLHGFIQYAGAPINMEGNTNYALLKAIENGASPYFTLSYRNTDILKEDTMYNKYYSIRYNIWVGETNDDGVFEYGQLIDLYSDLNEALSDLQASNLIDHKFLEGVRIPTAEEAEQDRIDAETKAEQEAAASGEKAEAENIKNINNVFFGDVVTVAEQALAAALEGDNATLYATLKNKLDAYNKAADANKAAAKEALAAAYGEYVGAKQANTAYKNAEYILLAYEFMTANLEKHGEAYYSSSFKADVNAKKAVADSIISKISAVVEAEEVLFETEEGKTETLKKYLVEDDSIVLVTYGKGTTAEKTFILNYNYFDVEVELEYNGKAIKTTIPAYGYVVEEWR